MTVDAAEVCTRHGLLFGQSTDGMWWCETPDQNPGVAGYPTAQTALCALLKALYRIEAKPLGFRWRTWWFCRLPTDARSSMALRRTGVGPTPFGSELECIVAQADAIAGVPTS
jgi:hypothetical protein